MAQSPKHPAREHHLLAATHHQAAAHHHLEAEHHHVRSARPKKPSSTQLRLSNIASLLTNIPRLPTLILINDDATRQDLALADEQAGRCMAAWGQTEPSGFVAGTRNLLRLRTGARRGGHRRLVASLRRRVLPRNRPPRQAAVISATGHVWTAPAVQEESDYQRTVRVRSCIRPLSAAVWPLDLM